MPLSVLIEAKFLEEVYPTPGKIRALIESWSTWWSDQIHDRPRVESGYTGGAGRGRMREEAGYEGTAVEYAELARQVDGLPPDEARAMRALYRDTEPLWYAVDGRTLYRLDPETKRTIRNYAAAARVAGLSEQSLGWHVKSGTDRLIARMTGQQESLSFAEATEKFLQERTERFLDYRLSAARLYSEYETWCRERRIRERNRERFDRHVASLGYALDAAPPKGWLNVRLRARGG